ncbi:unnamed protein product [Meloidogyne enterolobii]|uniref:Uncharacterized protein n=1 Tax=Meloidogyne enterolobii TaxID=390850 RepID=A0ACB1AJB6_MELEN
MDYDDDSDEPMDLDQHQRKFFDVGPFDPRRVDLNKPAMTAEEYLKQVIVDRSQQPAIAVASNLSLIMAQSSTSATTSRITNCLENQLEIFTTRFGPDSEWRTAKVNEFSLNRSLLEDKKAPPDILADIKLPTPLTYWLAFRLLNLSSGVRWSLGGDSQGWCQLCFERRIPELDINEEDKEKLEKFAHHKGIPPMLGLVRCLNDNLVNHLIMHQTEVKFMFILYKTFFCFVGNVFVLKCFLCFSHVFLLFWLCFYLFYNYVIENGHSRAILEWIYALLLVVKKPLLQDVVARLRDFCRKCREWRSQMDEDELDKIYELSWFITM